MNTFTIRVLQSPLPLILAASSFFVAAQAVAVQAPPRPPGSDRVLVEVGMNPMEVSRQKSAHNHARGARKDFTHDDTLDAPRPHGNHVQMFIMQDAHPGSKPSGKSRDPKPTPRAK